jgi:predicted  nucleic acid-binding Zn-ribbon protein
MNNEDKILSILEKIDQRQTSTEKILEKHGEMLEALVDDVSDLKSDVSDLKARITKIEVTQENIIIPNIQALAEGQKTILETLAPKNRVEALEDDVAFLKTVIKAMNQEINDLKKAQ